MSCADLSNTEKFIHIWSLTYRDGCSDLRLLGLGPINLQKFWCSIQVDAFYISCQSCRWSIIKFWTVCTRTVYCLQSTLKSWFCFPSLETNSHCSSLLATGSMERLCVFLLGLQILGSRADVTVDTESGRVRGAIKEFQGQDGSGRYFSFKGIPYAQPPVGDLVWRDPEPVSPWDGEVGNVIGFYKS